MVNGILNLQIIVERNAGKFKPPSSHHLHY